MTDSIQFIIPAAGFAQRHPGKLLTEVEGRPALARTVELIQEAGQRPLVVLGHRADQISKMLVAQFHGQVHTLMNSRYPEGMAYSIRTALNALGDLNCFAVHLGDKPFVGSDTIRKLTETFLAERPRMMLPTYQGEYGHPAFFDGSMKEVLMKTVGDQGGREIVEQLGDDVMFVDVNDRGILLDLDAYLELNGD